MELKLRLKTNLEEHDCGRSHLSKAIGLKMSQQNIALHNDSQFRTRFPYEELSDPRTQNWLLVSSFYNVPASIGIYLFVVWFLPKCMAKRNPLSLRPLLILYNLGNAFLNAYILKELFVATWHLNYSLRCEPYRVAYSEFDMQIVSAIWWYYFSKYMDLADTLFFILRKKTEQLTFLHVYHHSSMLVFWWICTKWIPTGAGVFPPMVNCFVHVIMYGYYGLSALGPEVQKYLWWKRYITALQLIQFGICFFYGLQLIVNHCDIPRWTSCSLMVYMTTFLILFGRFYRKSYKTQRLPRTTAKIASNSLYCRKQN